MNEQNVDNFLNELQDYVDQNIYLYNAKLAGLDAKRKNEIKEAIQRAKERMKINLVNG